MFLPNLIMFLPNQVKCFYTIWWQVVPNLGDGFLPILCKVSTARPTEVVVKLYSNIKRRKEGRKTENIHRLIKEGLLLFGGNAEMSDQSVWS